jgi:hypothetical protein
MSSRIVCTCARCGQRFEREPWAPFLKNTYCSRACAVPKTRLTLACAVCGAAFSTDPHRLQSGRGKYCGQACSDAGKRIMATSTSRLAARFAKNVEKNGPILRVDLGPCWVWTSTRSSNGYGRFAFSDQEHYAHRVAWFLHHGRWPDPYALHKCDGGEIGCVRIDHLFEGDDKLNALDKMSKGRQLRGETSPLAKLTERDILAIRAAVAAGTPRKAVAAHYQICLRYVGSIIHRKAWRHVEAPKAAS